DGERVVYALPFTSVIDQVVDEVETIYDTDAGSRLLTAHHHLAETTLDGTGADDGATADTADLDDDVAGMLAEGWRAGLTVTTFVQLFESLAGPRNRQSMKLPALRDAVVVLDEPQSLPIDWWKLAPRLVELLTERYGATVIAMTATQPDLFAGETELVDDPGSYFEAVERVSYRLDESAARYVNDEGSGETDPKPYGAAASELSAAVDGGGSALAICNTIESARELTDRVRDELGGVTDVGAVYADLLDAVSTADDVTGDALADAVVNASGGDVALLHLSTRLRPVDRLTFIEAAKALTDRERPLLAVSTQLVEAGVDISFERVYRDLAPMDGIVQAAGRCNRSFERDRGRVTVWWLDAPGEQEKTPGEAVYNRGTSLLPVTAAALRTTRGDDGSLTETAVATDAVDEYYRRLHEDRDVGSRAYADYVDDARGDALGQLSLIDQRRSVDVLVCRTETERARADAIRDAVATHEFDALRALLTETKPLRVSVPVYRGDEAAADAIGRLTPLVADDGLYELDVRDLPNYFDETTGFRIPESTVDHQFL
ncbi:CRISPR-associated helicase/endonuclease Cas3, partial [Halarchaeum acidiphilum]